MVRATIQIHKQSDNGLGELPLPRPENIRKKNRKRLKEKDFGKNSVKHHLRQFALLLFFSPNEVEGQKEWAIIELQGDLETRHPVPLSGKFIGDLHFSHKDAPVLIIGHHILHGKVVNLEKPIAVMVKSTSSDKVDTSLSTQTGDHGMDTECARLTGEQSMDFCGETKEGDKEMINRGSDLQRQKQETTNSTTYLVQAIIKKKILFKTRPKPIIAHVPKKL